MLELHEYAFLVILDDAGGIPLRPAEQRRLLLLSCVNLVADGQPRAIGAVRVLEPLRTVLTPQPVEKRPLALAGRVVQPRLYHPLLDEQRHVVGDAVILEAIRVAGNELPTRSPRNLRLVERRLGPIPDPEVTRGDVLVADVIDEIHDAPPPGHGEFLGVRGLIVASAVHFETVEVASAVHLEKVEVQRIELYLELPAPREGDDLSLEDGAPAVPAKK